jgi:hypothetical protein
LVSLLPTLLDFAGLSPASGLCGQSWAPGLRNGDEPRAEPIYVAALPDETTRYYQVAFLEGRHKLWLDVAMGSAKRFDVLADPGERSPSMVPEEIDAALGELNRFLAERGLPPVR